MSTPTRAAFETALKDMEPPLPTAFENDGFKPAAGVPYQKVDILYARPRNDEMSGNYTERGFAQVTLRYPSGKGPGASEDRALLIRARFRFGATLTAEGVSVNIAETPEIMPGYPDGDRWCVPVRIPFTAYVTA